MATVTDPATGEEVVWVSRKKCGIPKSRAPNGAWKRKHAIGHHGVGRGNGVTLREAMAIWRAYWRYHVEDRGWTDIGYTAGASDAVDVGGAILEGRDWGKDGGHTQRGGNVVGYALCYIGDGRYAVGDQFWRAFRAWLYKGIEDGAFPHDLKLSGHDDWWDKLCPGSEVKHPLHRKTKFEIEEEDPLAGIKDENQVFLDQMVDDMRKDGVPPNAPSFVTRAIRAARRHGKAHRDDFDGSDADQVGVMLADRANAGDRMRSEVAKHDYSIPGFVQKAVDLFRRE